MAQKEENINPVYVVRNKLGVSHEEFAWQLSLSKSTILRTEQGLYVDIPPEVLRRIKPFHSSPWSILPDYHRYQINQRDRNASLLRPIGEVKFDPWQKEHPFIDWRERCGITSRLEFCRLFCIHPATLKRYEDRISLSTPQYLLDVLAYCGIDWGTLEERYHLWRWNSGAVSRRNQRRIV